MKVDAAIWAPVLPALTKASLCPSACRRRPTAMELWGFPRIATDGLSVISMTSGASMTDRRDDAPPSEENSPARSVSSSARTMSERPTSWMVCSGPSS